MGIKISLQISQTMFQKSISINWPASFSIKNGVSIGANKVAMDVSVNDRATLALAMYDITFEAKPQGIQPTNIIPAAISGGNVKILVKPNPTNGMMVN